MFTLTMRPAWRTLSSSFRSVPLGLKLLGSPLDPREANIVQLDIHDSRRFGEYVRIWPGAPGSEIDVVHVDRTIRQLVLRVKDRRRPFAWEERRFLCGKDDVRLFIAELPRNASINSVTAAHLALEPRAAKDARRASPGSVVRQGEWFFLPLGPEETARLERYLASRPRAIKRGRPIDPAGRPHVADELVRIHGRRVREGSWEWVEHDTYVRGAVRHVGHDVLHLDGWRRVVRNREVTPGGHEVRARRVRWLD